MNYKGVSTKADFHDKTGQKRSKTSQGHIQGAVLLEDLEYKESHDGKGWAKGESQRVRLV